MAEVTFTIDTDGKVEVGVKGVKGKSCADLTAEAEKAFGEVTKTEKTREYNERPTVNNANTRKQ